MNTPLQRMDHIRQVIFQIGAIGSGAESHTVMGVIHQLHHAQNIFLVDDNTEEEFLIKAGNKDILDQDDTGIRAHLLQAHLQTTLLINECIALEMVMMNGNVKLVEPEGARKDRYTSVSYLNYYVSLMDIELLREKYTWNDEAEFLAFSRVY